MGGQPNTGRLRAADWRLLLQLDTDDEASMMWGDLGRLYFWITGDALRRRAFDPSPQLPAHNGIFPCFFGGLRSRLPRSIRSASISRGRLSRGSITSSMYPRAAAAYG